MIGDGHSVRVAADVIHHLLWSGEGGLSVDDPVHVSHRIEMTAESLRISQGLERSEELQLARVESLLQILQEQSTEQAGQHPHRQEEARAAGDPPGSIEGDSAARNDTMEVGMKNQGLSPTMEYSKEADFSSQMLGIGSNSGQSLGCGTSERLALGAVAICAAVVARPLVITGVAAFEMPAKGCGATHLDCSHDTPLSC